MDVDESPYLPLRLPALVRGRRFGMALLSGGLFHHLELLQLFRPEVGEAGRVTARNPCLRPPFGR